MLFAERRTLLRLQVAPEIRREAPQLGDFRVQCRVLAQQCFDFGAFGIIELIERERREFGIISLHESAEARCGRSEKPGCSSTSARSFFSPVWRRKPTLVTVSWVTLGNLFVGKIVLKFQANDFALVGREMLEQTEQRSLGVAAFQLRGRAWLGVGSFFGKRHGDDPAEFSLVIDRRDGGRR